MRKREALTLAERELSQARTVLEMHAIRSAMSGVIKTIYKQPREAVRRLEPVFLIQSHDRLRVEGLVDVEHVTQLRKGMQANIEPNEPQAPETILLGHLERIQAVAVTSQGEIVSGGADRTVRVWDRASKRERLTLSFPAAITSLACTSPPASRQLMVVGCGNGSVMICEVKDGTPLWQAQGEHLGAVTSAAFSPDGQWCATGGEDRSIIVWEVATGNVRYRLPEGHRGAVTWLSFTPQAELVSAARDNTIRLWSLGEKGASIRATFAHRSGEVTQPGTSADGQWTLYDDGGALRLLTLPTGRNAAIFHHPSKAARFSGFALLAPNGNTLVTSTAAGNVLDLWPTPRLSGRLVPLRQLLLLPGSQATCAAFAPDASFLCAGTDDRRILVWELPSDFEQRRPHVATLTLIERDVASTSPQVRVRAELPNAGGRLLPGMTATMVVPLR
ncbi:MAG: hypothetical protein KatS3mg105_1829 [Gemmatales bacterium]|nr:MAG: hypothetical protein KatS3mg105_1829 [Gemmatales bacterium]